MVLKTQYGMYGLTREYYHFNQQLEILFFVSGGHNPESGSPLIRLQSEFERNKVKWALKEIKKILH
jgi:hypothetical protein